LISNLSKGETETLFFNYQPDLDHTLKYIEKKHGKDYKAVIMPQAGLTLPVIDLV